MRDLAVRPPHPGGARADLPRATRVPGGPALAVIYLLLILWGPVPALRNWLGVLVLGALVALGFEAFRRVVLAEAGRRTCLWIEPPPPAPAT